jgi:cell division protein FtsB
VLMQNKVSRLEQEDRELRMEYQTLLKEVHDLETESLAVEKIAREKYKLCRENEQILIYK